MSRVAICVPVRDEAAGLPGLLAGLAAQTLPPGTRLTLCVLLDQCRDGSGDLVRSAALPFPVTLGIGVGAGGPNAGAARRAAFALATSAAEVLLSTDGDTVPAPDWVAAALAALARADVVAGRIERDGQHGRHPAQDRVETYWERLHALRRRLDPLPWEESCAHHQAGGANLGFRAAAYQALDGFTPVPSGEDALILDEAERAGLRVRRDRAMRVVTSSRRHGRAPGGFAQALGRLDEDNALGGLTVADPVGCAWQFARHALARASFDRLDHAPVAARLAAAIALPPAHLRGVARDCPNAHAFAARIVPAAPARREVPLAEAELALARLEAAALEAAA